MTNFTGDSLSHPHRSGLVDLHRNWGWLLALGILMVVLGLFALGYAGLATLASVLVVGWVLFFEGVLQWVTAFWSRAWSGTLLHILAGLLALVVGVMLLRNPAAGAVALTMVMSIFFVVGGVFRIVTALTMRFSHWGWLLLSGIVTLALGILIWRQMPLSSFWVIGLFVGIDLVFYGWWLLMLSMVIKRLPERAV